MALVWNRKTDGVDFIVAKDVNDLADAIIQNEEDIASQGEQISTIAADVSQLQSDVGDMRSYTVEEFSEEEEYYAGAYCIYDRGLWKFQAYHNGPWTGSDAVMVMIMDEIATANSRIVQIATDVAGKANASIIAEEFSTTTQYHDGDYALHNGQLYRFQDDFIGDWSSTSGIVAEVVVLNEVKRKYKLPDTGIPENDLSAGVKKLIYGAYPTETLSGAAVHTALGADNVPVTSLTITASAAGSYTVNRVGKNLFKQETNYNLIQKNITTPSGDRYGYKLQFPAGYYYGYAWVVSGSGSRNSNVMFGVFDSDGNDKTSERVMYSTGAMAPSHSTYGVAWIGITGVSANRDKVRIEIADGEYILVYGNEEYLNRGAQDLVTCNFMIIPGSSDPAIPVAPEYVNGITPTQFPVTVPVADTPTDVPIAATMLGDNTFYTVPVTGVTATLDGTFRLDPTLVYNALRGT